jgi:hypothetical protein
MRPPLTSGLKNLLQSAMMRAGAGFLDEHEIQIGRVCRAAFSGGMVWMGLSR